MVFQHICHLDTILVRESSVTRDQTLQGLLLPTEMPGQGTSLCMSQQKKTSELDVIYHLHGHQCGC